jgi:hypothetical protein
MSGSGFSIYNNTEIEYQNPSYSAGQHADGWQTSGASYVKIYNNFIYGFGDIGLYGGCWGNAVSGGSHTFSHVRIYNNIIDGAEYIAVGCIEIEADNQSGSTFSDIQIMNNLCRVPATGVGWCLYVGSAGTTGGTWANNFATNNICICGSSPFRFSINNCVFPEGNNPMFTDAQAATLFTSFVARSTNSNYHLSSTASALIGKGANLYAFLTTDKDGNAQPSSGAWDIGPYIFGSSIGNTNPAILISPASLDFGTVLASTGTNLTLTVQNTGGGTLSGVVSVASPFQIVSGGTYNLGSNQTQTVTVKFNPAAAGTYNQTINFTGGNGASASMTGAAYATQSDLSFNAADGSIVAPFTVTASALVPSGSYISQAGTTGLSGSGEAIYDFTIVTNASYVISALVNAPSTAANSFYVNIDGQPTQR